MLTKRFVLVGFMICLAVAGTVLADAVQLKISGPGAVDENTIKAGEKVFFDIYCQSDTMRTGFTLGFSVKSEDIKSVVHVMDSGNGLNGTGDIKGYDGWNDKSIWDFNGVFIVEQDWDGLLPDLIGFGALSIKKGYPTSAMAKKLSFEMVIPDPGTLVVDSAFYPPGGKWLFSSPPRIAEPQSPAWPGPYTFKVIK